MWSLVTGLFHLAWCSQGLSKLYVSVLHAFLWNPIIWYSTFYLSVGGYLDCFHFWIILVMLLWTFVYKLLCEMCIFISFGYVYLGVELLTRTVINLYLSFEKPPECFPKFLYHFTFPPAVCEGLNFSTSMSTLVFLIIAVLVGVKWCLIVALIYVSLMTKDIQHLFICLLAQTCLPFLEIMNIYCRCISH